MTSLKIYHISSMRRKRNTGRKDKTQQTCDKLRFLINPSSLHQRRKKDGPAPKTRLNIFRKINPGPDPCNTIYNKRQRTSRDKKENYIQYTEYIGGGILHHQIVKMPNGRVTTRQRQTISLTFSRNELFLDK
jgi:hypothetical protein